VTDQPNLPGLTHDRHLAGFPLSEPCPVCGAPPTAIPIPRGTASRPRAREERTALYVSGTISSDPSLSFEEARARFDRARDDLAAAGYDPVSPVDCHPTEEECGLAPEECLATQRHQMPGQGQGKHSWECYLRADLRAMLLCGGVALLPNWHLSTGARLEFNTAVACGLPCKPVEEWLADPPGAPFLDDEDRRTADEHVAEGVRITGADSGHVDLEDVDGRLSWLLRRAGEEWGPTGVQRAATRLAAGDYTTEVGGQLFTQAQWEAVQGYADRRDPGPTTPPTRGERVYRDPMDDASDDEDPAFPYCGGCGAAERNHGPGGSRYGVCQFVGPGARDACSQCGRPVEWDGRHWRDLDAGDQKYSEVCPASKDPDPRHTPSLKPLARRTEVAIEGKPSVDGRLVEPGALKWPMDPVPVRAGGAEAAVIVGKADRFARDRGTVSCRVLLREGAVGREHNAHLDVRLDKSRREDALLVVEDAKILGLYLTPAPGAWPELDATGPAERAE
jgi:hypothetical protein